MLFATQIQQPSAGTWELESEIDSRERTGFLVLCDQKFVNFIINLGLPAKENVRSLNSVDRPVGPQVLPSPNS